PSAWMQILIILAAGLLGLKLFQDKAASKIESFHVKISKKAGVTSLLILVGALIVLPILNNALNNSLINIFYVFFRVGSLVSGCAHVVLPMIERELVPLGFLPPYAFLAGYELAQAVPGPLFTFSSYLRTIMAGITGAVVVTIAIFLPSFLLIVAA